MNDYSYHGVSSITNTFEYSMNCFSDYIHIEQITSLSLIVQFKLGAFHLHTSVYLLRTLIPSFAHDSAYHLRTFFTPH